jgi:hypothetical protein
MTPRSPIPRLDLVKEFLGAIPRIAINLGGSLRLRRRS